MLIEECWRNNILLVGIAKDSSTAYLSHFYLDVFREEKKGNDFEIYEFDKKSLPWTDRLLLEALALFKEEFEAPWSTIEFDSAIITLRRSYNDKQLPIVVGSGMNNTIYYPERIFLRSLGQHRQKSLYILPA